MDTPICDEYPEVRVGDTVQAVRQVVDADTGEEVARPGDVGTVVSKGAYSAPTVHWDRSNHVADAIPRLQFEVLCGAGFSTSPETTPRKPMREFVRRGVS